jgi:hypothetical protein
MSEEEVLGGRVEIADIALPFTPDLNEAYDTNPMYRLVLDVSESSSMGFLELGYFIKINYGVYFIRKKIISVFTNTQSERVFQFLKKTQKEFVISVYHDRTNSGHQYIQLYDVELDEGFYTVRDFAVYKSLWQTIEGELFENLYTPSMARFTDSRLVWYVKLFPQHSLTFSEVGKLRLQYLTAQGHLEIYKIEKEGDFVLPIYLYIPRESLRFFNHEINQRLDVIPLGSERRIISVGKETQIISSDHDPVTLDVGQYLLWHPRPQQQNKVD